MNTAQRTIGDLVAEDYRRATIFKQHGIDFCCGGGTSLETACARKNIPLEDMQRALEEAEQTSSSESMRPAAWSPDFLADYIVNQHHVYVRESAPILMEFTGKVARVHGEGNPEVVEIAGLFGELSDEMHQHMIKEEQVLFPHIKKLVHADKSCAIPEKPAFGTIRNPIRMMEHEHDRAGDLMREIRTLSGDYTPPGHACATWRVSYAKLEEFESDLHRHVHLENNILFPAAAVLEEKLSAYDSG